MGNGNGKDNELMPMEDSAALIAITKGEVDMQVSTAKAYPRSVDNSIKKATTLATMDKETAESCFFALPRAGGLIEGPSIRLAEIIASSWGNMRCESRIIEEGTKHVTAQATAWDMETNTLVRIEAKRRITDKNGNRFKDDMIMMTQNAAISIALRNAVFRVVPRSFVDQIYKGARKVALGDAHTIKQRRSAAFYTFSKWGVTEERILAVIDKPAADDIDAEDLSKLLGLLNAIREGSTTVEDAFPELPKDDGSTPNGSKTDQVLEQLQGKEPEKKPEHEPENNSPVNEDSEPPIMAQDLISAAAASSVPQEKFNDILKECEIRLNDKRSQKNQERMQKALEMLDKWEMKEDATSTQTDQSPPRD